MSIRTNCPRCGSICGFMDSHAGRVARCLSCGKRFYVPAVDGAAARVYESPAGEPEPYFFRRVFLRGWQLFLLRGNFIIFLAICAAVTFKYFFGTQDYSFVILRFAVNIPIGWVSNILVWGFLFWYYMELIRAAALNESDLPEPDIGRGLEFIWNAVLSIYYFIVAFCLAEIPFIIVLNILGLAGLGSGILNVILFLMGFQFFPMVLLIIAVGQPWQVFNPRNVFKPVFKAAGAYFSVSLSLTLLWGLQWETLGYYKENVLLKPAWQMVVEILSLVAIQAGVIVVMRGVGLFFQHYQCYMPFVERD